MILNQTIYFTYSVFPAIDGNWGQWSEWSPVVGKDQKERKRICNKPQPMFDGKACEGSDKEVVDVLKGPLLYQKLEFKP